jgi:DNA mismatch repair ATPase MutL
MSLLSSRFDALFETIPTSMEAINQFLEKCETLHPSSEEITPEGEWTASFPSPTKKETKADKTIIVSSSTASTKKSDSTSSYSTSEEEENFYSAFIEEMWKTEETEEETSSEESEEETSSEESEETSSEEESEESEEETSSEESEEKKEKELEKAWRCVLSFMEHSSTKTKTPVIGKEGVLFCIGYFTHKDLKHTRSVIIVEDNLHFDKLGITFSYGGYDLWTMKCFLREFFDYRERYPSE